MSENYNKNKKTGLTYLDELSKEDRKIAFKNMREDLELPNPGRADSAPRYLLYYYQGKEESR